MNRFTIALFVSFAVFACGPAGRSTTMNTDMSLPGDDQGVDPTMFPVGSFGATCNGAATLLTGVVKAPNGSDPVALAHVYVVDHPKTLAPGVACEICGSPLDTALAAATSSPDGHFTLNLDHLPSTGEVNLVVAKGRFRRVTKVAVKACASAVASGSAVTLPGRAKEGDIPKIAVATGNTDHLDVVLDALGIHEFDCFNGTKSGAVGTGVTPCSTSTTDVATLLAAPAKLASYNMLFLSCAPGKFATLTNQATVVSNLEAWVKAGGRLFVTDESYNIVEQAFPTEIDFYPGTKTPAVPQSVDQANLGVGASLKMGGASYPGMITDPDLQTWLQAVGAISPEANGLTLTGFLNPWAAQKDVGKDVKTEVVAQAAYYTTAATTNGSPSSTATMPMTVEWDYQMCGRVLFTSYHTLAATQSGAKLSAQEKILEYLMLDISSCVGPIG